MSGESRFTAEEARTTGERIGIDWATSPFDVEQFRMGMDVELEHGTQDPETNVTDDDLIMTGKIARAHLNEFPDYYSRLAVMEAEAEAHRASEGGQAAGPSSDS
jgi:DNA-directed RNA polymerase alpha subunit